jgi:16S rRNA (guanine(527)-N(7))-methyltransferase RsmG
MREFSLERAVLEMSSALGRPIGSRASERMRAFLKEVLEWGDRIHLVGRGDIAGNIERQAADSAELLRIFEKNGMRSREEGSSLIHLRVADIGSGAGFPGMVWKILSPGLHVFLFERKKKIAAFLERTARRVGLEGLEVLDFDAAKYSGEALEGMVSKASGRLESMLPLASSLLAEGGVYITVKGKDWESGEALPGNISFSIQPVPLSSKRGVALIFRKKLSG